jgi:hypothetical protein
MSGRGLVVGLTLTVTLVGTFCVAQADARPIFRLAGGGWQESPLAPLGWVGAGAVAPLRAAADSCSSTAGASPGSVGTRSPTRFGSGGPPAAPACGDYPGRPVATAAGNRGDLLVAGLWFGRVVRLARGGRARIVAGPKAGESGEFFSAIGGLAVLRGGGFLVSDTGSRRVLRVSANGRVTTVAGTGRAGSSGDGGPAVAASFRRPMGLAVEADGSFLVADPAERRVRRAGSQLSPATAASSGAGPRTPVKTRGPRATSSMGSVAPPRVLRSGR